MAQERQAAIVGIHEYPLRVAPGVSAMNIKVDSIRAALDDAGLKWSDIDAIYDAQDGEAGGGLQLAAYLGVRPTVLDTTQVGGSSYEFQAAHAMRDIAAGKCNVAVLSYGSTSASNRGRDRHGWPGWSGDVGDEHGGPVRLHPDLELRDGETAPHVRVRHDGRAVRGYLGGDAAPRDAEPRGREGDDGPAVRGRERDHAPGRARLPRGGGSAAPAGVLHDQRRWRGR